MHLRCCFVTDIDGYKVSNGNLLVQDVVGEMKREIHRMELRKHDLERTKEQLVKELERAIEKRGTISVKGRAAAVNAKKRGGKLTEKQLVAKCSELHRSIGDTDTECGATDARIAAMERKRMIVSEQVELVATRCGDLRAQDARTDEDLQRLMSSQTSRVLETQQLQAASQLLEGTLRGDSAQLSANNVELPPEEGLSMFRESLDMQQDAIKAVASKLAASNEAAAPRLRQALLHAEALQCL